MGILKTKKAPKKRYNSRRCGGKESLNQWHQPHLTKMGIHGFRTPDKEAVDLEAQRNPLQSMDSLASL